MPTTIKSPDEIMKEAKGSYWRTDGGDTDYATELKKALKDMYFIATGKEYEGTL